MSKVAMGLHVVKSGLVLGIVFAVAMAVGSVWERPNEVKKEYYADGVLAASKGFDRKGELHGVSKEFNADSTLSEEVKYYHGQIIYQKIYRADGSLLSERKENPKTMCLETTYYPEK